MSKAVPTYPINPKPQAQSNEAKNSFSFPSHFLLEHLSTRMLNVWSLSKPAETSSTSHPRTLLSPFQHPLRQVQYNTVPHAQPLT